MNWFLHLLDLPPAGHETALHFDLASAFIAFLALAFSVYTFFHQRRLRALALLAQRDSGLIRWTELAIDTIVEIEFLLRKRTASAGAAQYADERDELLAKLAAVIDKGRLYFPKFTRDVVKVPSTPEPAPAGPQNKPALLSATLPLLDDLVEIYDLTNKVDFRDEPAMKKAQSDVMIKKRDFIKTAQNEVEFRRVPGIVE
jgi:hypothetical protein